MFLGYNNPMRQMIINLMARYLSWCARRVINRADRKTPIIGITGSTGKTSTKEMMGLIAKESIGAGVIVAPGNLNNEVGLPLAILGFTEVPNLWQYIAIKFQALWRAFFMNPASGYVLEYGIDHPGDMDFLLSIVRPSVAVLTNITPVHLEYFASKEDLVNEKAKLGSAANEYVIINGDDKNLATINFGNRKVLKFGRDAGSDLQLKNYNLNEIHTDFTVSYGKKEMAFTIAALGEQHIMSAMPAILFGLINNLGEEQIRAALLSYKPMPGRGNIIKGKNSSIIINETYNANPLSVEKALDVLGKMKGSPKIAVLGDMLELGSESHSEHQRILELAKEQADLVFTVGPRMKEAGGGEKSFEDPNSAAQYLYDRVERDSVMLVKGSQGMRMEFIVKKLMQDPSLAEKELPRQGRQWLKTPFKPI